MSVRSRQRGYLEISRVLGPQKEVSHNSSVSSPRWMLSMDQETLSEDRSGAPTLRRSYGSIQEIACRGKKGKPSRATSITSTKKL